MAHVTVCEEERVQVDPPQQVWDLALFLKQEPHACNPSGRNTSAQYGTTYMVRHEVEKFKG